LLSWRMLWFFFSSRRRHTRFSRDWSSDVCSSDLPPPSPRRSRLLLGRAGLGGRQRGDEGLLGHLDPSDHLHPLLALLLLLQQLRSEERRVGKGWRSGWRA